MNYPRRDEGQATSVSYSYDRGWLTGTTATLRDPFNPTGTASVDLLYNPSGNPSQTQVYSNGSKVFKLRTPDDPSGIARPAQFLADRTPSDVGWEYAGYSYDGSGNVSSFGTSLFGYDARSRLSVDIMYGLTEYRRYDDFGNVTLSTSPWRTFNPDRATNRHSQPNPYPNYQEYDSARGYLKYDSTSYLGRDFYADGGVLSEYGRYAPSYATVRDLSVYLLDGDKERLMTFNGEDGRCDTELFRHTLRDPSGRVLTDYKADNQGYCNCSDTPCQWTDRFERDYIWLGTQALVILDRQQAPRFDVLDHLGSPRHACNSDGVPLGDRVFVPFGEELGVAGTMPERIRFTGHERNHVTGSDGQYLAISDYMHARNYAPTLSRFVTPDSRSGFHLFKPDTANRYAYAFEAPLSLVDSSGLDPGEPESVQPQHWYFTTTYRDNVKGDFASAYVAVEVMSGLRFAINSAAGKTLRNPVDFVRLYSGRTATLTNFQRGLGDPLGRSALLAHGVDTGGILWDGAILPLDEPVKNRNPLICLAACSSDQIARNFLSREVPGQSVIAIHGRMDTVNLAGVVQLFYQTLAQGQSANMIFNVLRNGYGDQVRLIRLEGK
jgi:RHS repeat-associated protein